MLTSFCFGAKILSQMRLNRQTQTHTYHSHHHQLPWLALWLKSPCCVCICFVLLVSKRSHLNFPLPPFLVVSISLSVSVTMNQGEAVTGTALWLCYRLRSPSASSLAHSSPLPPSFSPLHEANGRNWPKSNMEQGQEGTLLFVCVF